MQTKIVEATNGFNWGKFMVGRFDEQEWRYRSLVSDSGMPLLREIGWGPGHLWVLDLQTGEGAYFRISPYGIAHSDLNKHKVWVCPMFEPFLQWLYGQDVADLAQLPAVVDLAGAESAIWGYRRPGEETQPFDPASLPEDIARAAAEQVEIGRFASVEDVLRAGIAAVQAGAPAAASRAVTPISRGRKPSKRRRAING